MEKRTAELLLTKDKETVHLIICVHHIDGAPEVKPCPYKTPEGIGIGSTESEVIAAYGEPYKRQKIFLGYKEPNLIFELEDGKVNRINVLTPR